METTVDTFDAYPLTMQFLYDAIAQNGSGINKHNRYSYNGFRMSWDSARSFNFFPKVGLPGDTSYYVGSPGKHILRYSDGTIEIMGGISGLTIGNDYATISGSDGVYLSEIKAAGTTAIVRSYNPISLVSAAIQTDYDSVAISAPKINIGPLPSVSDTSTYKPIVQDLATKRMAVLNRWPGGAGGGGGDVSSVFGRTGIVVAANGDYTWAQINKSSSSLADITTRNWSDLQNKPTTLATIGITDAQPLDGDLTSISAISSNGIPKRTGANTWSIATAGTDYSPAINTTDHLLNLTPATGAINMRKSITALTSGTSISVDMDNGPNYSLSLAHNAAITISDEQAGDWFQLWVTQTAGSNTLTIEGQAINIRTAASSATWVGGSYNGSVWIFATDGALPITQGGTGLTSLGTANQLIRVNSGATALEYFTPSYLTGNQSISFAPTGDVTGSTSGTTSLAPSLTIGNGVVTYTKMQNVSATSRIMGRITAGSGSMEELTGAQATTLLSPYAGSSKGLVPAGTGSLTRFLREDGSWADPLANANVGQYTPTLTWVNGGNTATAAGFTYSASGDAVKIVKISGRINVNSATDATNNLWQIRVSLPSGLTEAFGTVNSVTGVISVSLTNSSYVPNIDAAQLTNGFCTADITNNEILLNFREPTTDGYFSLWIECTYTITND
ncbi:MAG: hypothetical protein ACTHMV_13640 [Chitinophagaceae bacterium]